MCETGLPPSILTHYGGGTSDNAGDAQREIALSFEKVQSLIPQDHRLLHGVARLPIQFGDWYHIDNLIVTHSSKAAFGETERGNHSECHHRQLLESIHNLNTYDSDLAQATMNKILEKNNLPPMKLKTTHEKVQR